MLESRTALSLCSGSAVILCLLTNHFPALCFFMIYKPSFKTDFLPFQWSECNGRKNAHPEQKEGNTGMKLTETANVVLRLQPEFEIALKKPQSWGSCAQATFTAVPWHTSVCWHFMWIFQCSWNVQSSTETPEVLKSFSLTSSGVEMTISRRLQSSLITTMSPDNSVQPVVGTCNI